jgi:cytidyltransferase-like protein
VTRVYVDMVADLFHFGHVEFLRTAKALGSELVVGIHSDTDVASYKRRPIMSMEERAGVVAACRYVDEVLSHAPLRVSAEWIAAHRLDVVVHGDDLDEESRRFFYAVPISLGVFREIPYTAGISTSDVLERIRSRADEAS